LRAQSRSETELLERFRLRSEIGSRFLTSYVEDLLTREKAEAVRQLGSRDVPEQRFARLSRVLGFKAAVLLDGEGRLLAVEPAAPELLGNEIASTYPHLSGAVAGRASVSNIVSSAARSVPVVGLAVPFPADTGRRVFSGALSITDNTLGSSYLKNLVPLPGRAGLPGGRDGRNDREQSRGSTAGRPAADAG
jgi:hypothetical protein